MKRFIRLLSIFVLLLAILSVIADKAISKGLTGIERGHFYTMNALMNQTMDADVIILGSSRASSAYHPYVLDTVLNVNSRNLGVSGQPFGVSVLRWRLYRRNNCPPKLLIINMDYSELDMVTNGFEREQYYPYMKDTLVRPYLNLYGFNWAEKNLPLYRYHGNFKLMGIGLTELLHIRHDTKEVYCKGYTNPPGEWSGEHLEAVLKKGKVKGKSNPEAISLLEDLIQDAQRDSIPILFVYSPMYSRLKDNLDEEQSLSAYYTLSERYGIPVLDFSRMDFCNDTTFFSDGNHVNDMGARRFSEALGRAIDSLGILKRPLSDNN